MRPRKLLFFMLIGLLLFGGSVLAAPFQQEDDPTPQPQVPALDEALRIFAFDTRVDMELLAEEVFGGTFPPSWTGNGDFDSPAAIADLWFDNEALADAIFGQGNRPPEWFGIAGANPNLIARNVRHDLEVAADQYYGLNDRPGEWRGAPPILRCERTLQNVVDLLQEFYGLQIATAESTLNYCRAVTAEIEDDMIEAAFGGDREAQLPDLILAVRGDLERLADETQGLNNRPPGWIGNRDRTSITLVGDNFLDLETLADTLLGDGIRPGDWIGGVTNSPATSYQNLRHDLELLADEALGGERPNGWQGVDPILICTPLAQNLVYLIQANYEFTPNVDASADDYCQQVVLAANLLAENPPVFDVVVEDIDVRLTATSNYAFSYLDFAATQYMGIMPGGVSFRAWYRNYGDSNMMFVSGDNFALWLDYRFTTLPALTYDTLPTRENVSPVSFCDADWCNGPSPTPTPTGFGPLVQIILEATPQMTPTPIGTPGVGDITKTQVSWNNLRLTYIQDNPQTRTAQVAIEICLQNAENASACQPVTTVTELATGVVRQPVATYNGINVYDFTYGYTQNIRIEGETIFSNDIWVSDPTIR